MRCKRCGNTDKEFFYKGSKGYYCRKCVSFKRTLILEDLESLEYEVNNKANAYDYGFKLTTKQEEVSKKCLEIIKEKDVLLNCVCGAGKTELVVESIAYYLSLNKKVAYAIARKEVVIELEKRFKKIFPDARVVSLYGGHHNELTGDLIICTSHQLFRYYQTFDLLILDEVDAFPLKGNETLMNISLNSCKGRIIFSTATVDKTLMKIINKRNYQTLNLYTRPNYKPLVIPKIYYLRGIIKYLMVFYLLKKIDGQCIIFVSTRKKCKLLYQVFKRLFKITYVYSDLADRNSNIKDFKDKKYDFIISTSVLERGITIKDVSVLILYDKKTFDQSSLIQMLGRVLRGDSKKGEAYIIAPIKDKEIKNTLAYLKEANDHL